MVSYLPSSIQKRLLRYALLKTGLLDAQELDLDDLDITLGRHNNVELRNVGLNVQRLSALLELPPQLRLEAAKVLQLRLYVPADLYNGSIKAEAHGVECELALVNVQKSNPEGPSRDRRDPDSRTPLHRKTKRRIGRSPPFDPGGDAGYEGVPTTQDLARSFLLDEPREEVRQLSEKYASQAGRLAESNASVDDTLGTGAGPGLPGFLAGFLQGIVDRFRFQVVNVTATLRVPGPSSSVSHGSADVPEEQVGLILTIESIDLDKVSPPPDSLGENSLSGNAERLIQIQGIRVSLDGLSSTTSSPTGSMPSETAISQTTTQPLQARNPPRVSEQPTRSSEDVEILATQSNTASFRPQTSVGPQKNEPGPSDQLETALRSDDQDPMEIQAGEDNLAWNYRRSESGTGTLDVFKNLDSPLDLARSAHADQHLMASRIDMTGCEQSSSLSSSRESVVLTRADAAKLSQTNASGQWDVNSPSAPATFIPTSHSGELEPELDASTAKMMHSPISSGSASASSDQESESMYLSAFGGDPVFHSLIAEPHDKSGETQRDVATSQVLTTPAIVEGFEVQDVAHDQEPISLAATPESRQPFASDVPRPRISKLSSATPILFVECVNLHLFGAASSDDPNDVDGSSPPIPANPISADSRHEGHIPGSFSSYAEQSASVRFEDPNSRSVDDMGDRVKTAPTGLGTIQMMISNAYLAFEISFLAEYMNLIKTLMVFLSHDDSVKETRVPSAAPRPSPTFDLTVKQFSCDLVASQREHWSYVSKLGQLRLDERLSSPSALLGMQFKNARYQSHAVDSVLDWTLDVGTLFGHINNESLIRFSTPLQESRRSVQMSDADIHVEAGRPLEGANGTKVSQISVQTKRVEFQLAFDQVEQTFNSYGGLSSLLELSSSLSKSRSSPMPPSPPARKGVHFDDTVKSPSIKSEIKLNARVGGFHASISSRGVSATLSTSAIKAVARPEYVAIAIGNINLLGPFTSSTARLSRPIDIAVSSLRLEYLLQSKDADLERLLSLLTPSKNKYEEDDDFLLDTLLRQRRKGAVVRLSSSQLQCNIQDWAFIETVQVLLDDLSSLAAVTKYLPEDERPGVLTLVHLSETQVKLPINETFGPLSVALSHAQIAHVGLPSLLAMSVGSLKAKKDDRMDLLHPFIQISEGDGLPMLMIKLIGDEVEPTLRIKLFNVCLEYSVPIILALTDDTNVKVEDAIDLAASTVMTVAGAATGRTESPSSVTSSTTKSNKRLTLDILFHDCEIGLQPQDLQSKAVVVLSNAKIATVVPPKDIIIASLDIRKAALYVTDKQVDSAEAQQTVHWGSGHSLEDALADRGYVSTASIMAARLETHITEGAAQNDRSVEVEIRNDLFLLETCADSTQTLLQTLSALAPPGPPSVEEKYRVEPMTMDEMVSSFTGNAFEKPASPPSTIFDADNAIAPEDEEDLIDASMSESLYGGLDALEDPSDDFMVQEDTPGEIAESLLDEDPFEIPDNPNAAKLSNRDLTKELDAQVAVDVEQEPVILSPSYMSVTEMDRLPGESMVLGAPYRWRTPKTQHPTIPLIPRQSLPFKLRVRDVHVIWNLYDGYDWQGTRQAITQAVEEVEIKAEERRLRGRSAQDDDDEESIIGDCLFNSIYIGVPASKEAQDLRRQINKGIDDLVSESESYATSGLTKPTNVSGGSGQRARRRPRRLRLERSKARKIAFELRGVSADVLILSPGVDEVQNTVDVRVRDLDIFDNLPTSTWRKFMTAWHKDNEEREIAKPMVHIEMQNIRPIKELSATEIALCVTVTPVRLHVDQDALDFITRFFEFKDSNATVPSEPSGEPFLQRVEVHTVDMALDYKPKRVDYTGLRSGRYTEFKNFFILDNAHIILRHAILYGIRGFDVLNDTLNDIWMPDIKRNQLPGVLSGLATVSPLVNLGTGVAGVISVPIKEYQKNGRIVRSIQKGAVHLARDTTGEIARFGARVAVGTQNLLTGAETMLSPAMGTPSRRRSANVEGWTDVEEEEREQRAVSSYANQPLGVLQGLRSARRYLERDLLTARDAVIAVQGEVLDSASASEAAQAVVRHAPTILLRPVIGATRAVGQTLMGVGNQVDRGNVRKIEDKYKQR